ncbi:hypothetical protein [Ferruginibacter sp.]
MLKELEDHNWFPAILRRWQMEFIGNMAVWTKLYQPLAPVLQQLIQQNKITALQDTCSGSGIPAVYIHQQLANKIPLLLTDKYPDLSFKNSEAITYAAPTADVLKMEFNNSACYTMYNAFHHFSNEEQQLLLKRFSEAGTSFLIAEILEPSVLNVLKIAVTGIVLQLFTAPFVRPFSWARLFFTYIIPVNLFTVTYDGIISVLKSKTVQQYAAMLKNDTTAYIITVDTIKNWKGNIVYLKGQPVNL